MTGHNAREHNPQERKAQEHMEHVQREAARLHRQGTEVAGHVADTEEQVAATLEEIAAHRPAADA
ncbi:MAG: hypothetical protein J2P29_03270, partial [Actinobacteria bacterium]|nr:hypothetical protein [Actinomycetota bacterium]